MKFRNQEYYEKIRASPTHSVKPFFDKSNWLISIITLTMSVALGPFLSIRRTHIVPSSLKGYFNQVMFFAGIAIVLALPLLWVMQFRPYFEMKSGHYYVGKFEIIGKRQILGYCYLLLIPGKRNWVKVNQEIFYSAKIGEAIELKRAPFGTISSLKKIHNIRRRIKDVCHKKWRHEQLESFNEPSN